MTTFTLIRIHKDLDELTKSLPPWIKVDCCIGGSKNYYSISITISVPNGPFQGKILPFIFLIPPLYPFKEPRIIFQGGHLFHPNIDYTSGSVCMDILRLEWRPIFSLNVLLQGLLCLLMDMDSMSVTDDPLNKDAASSIIDGTFERLLQQSMEGGTIGGKKYTKLDKFISF